MILALLTWNTDPVLIRLGPLPIRWYSFLFALTFFLGFLIVRWMYRIEQKPEEDVDRLLTYTIIGTVAGARLGHCLFYDPVYYLGNPLEILKVWQGGLASHGGAIGIVAAVLLYSRKVPSQPPLWVLDRIAVVTALGGFFIRLGNFFNSEILGAPADGIPWAVTFTRVDDLPRHPAQLYESFSYGAIFFLLLRLYRTRAGRTPHGLLLGLFFVVGFTARFFIEFVKMRQAAYEHDFPLSVGQLLSIPVILVGAWLLLRLRRTGSPAA